MKGGYECVHAESAPHIEHAVTFPDANAFEWIAHSLEVKGVCITDRILLLQRVTEEREDGFCTPTTSLYIRRFADPFVGRRSLFLGVF